MRAVALMGCLAGWAVCSAAAPALAGPPEKIAPFLAEHCAACHDSASPEAGLDLAGLDWSPADRANSERWVRIYDRVAQGEMPPPSESRPSAEDQTQFLDLLGRGLRAADLRRQQSEGRVVLRRLNRVEYENTLHDLLAIDLPLAQLLPEDTPAHGFDTVAEGQRLSALQIEKYLEAADLAIEAAIRLEVRPEQTNVRYSYKDERDIRQNLDTPEGQVRDPVSGERHHIIFKELPDAVVFFSDGYSPTDLRQPHGGVAGRYRVRVSAYGHQSNGQPVTLRLYANNYREQRLLGFFDMPADAPREAELVVRLEENEHLKVVPYATGYDAQGRGVWEAPTGPEYQGVGLAVQWIAIAGPLAESWPPPSTTRLFPDVPLAELPENQRPWRNGRQLGYALAPDDPSAALADVLEQFAQRAFRRPLRAGEVDGFVALAAAELAAGRTFEQAARVGLRAILAAPEFLLFEAEPGPLDDYALATRLAYFLWSGPPDDELLALAAQGRLRDDATLRGQVERMLAAPRSGELARNFCGQWLDLRRIAATSPDSRLYPEFDELLGVSMVGETEAFFAELLQHDLSTDHFIDSPFVTINRRLAEHYGLPGVVGEEFRRVELPADSPRGGVLTQAGILKVTANGTVTSPVLRGSWVLKRLLGRPPPPPPPVPAIEPDTRGATTIREQLARHRDSAVCASCHASIDPPGFALESFDVIGGWRARYRALETGEQPPWQLRNRNIWEYKLGLPVDASGALADGRQFADIREFKRLLLAEQTQVLRTLAQNLLIYGTGARIDFADRAVVEQIVQRTQERGGGLRTLVHEIVQSSAFRQK